MRSSALVRRAFMLGSIFASVPSVGYGDDLNAYFDKDDSRQHAAIDYSECTGDEVTECVSHSLSCDEFGSPYFTIIVGPVDAIATRLIVGTEGEAEGRLSLAGDAGEILVINSIEVVANELDGGWMLLLRFSNGEELLDALSATSTESAYVEIGGERFSLAPQPGDGAKLIEFKTACADLRQKAALTP